jgi:hypothetical protein
MVIYALPPLSFHYLEIRPTLSSQDSQHHYWLELLPGHSCLFPAAYSNMSPAPEAILGHRLSHLL